MRRGNRRALITVGDGTTQETYRVALDEDVQYPAGIPDDIRYSFASDTGPAGPFAQRIDSRPATVLGAKPTRIGSGPFSGSSPKGGQCRPKQVYWDAVVRLTPMGVLEWSR